MKQSVVAGLVASLFVTVACHKKEKDSVVAPENKSNVSPIEEKAGEPNSEKETSAPSTGGTSTESKPQTVVPGAPELEALRASLKQDPQAGFAILAELGGKKFIITGGDPVTHGFRSVAAEKARLALDATSDLASVIMTKHKQTADLAESDWFDFYPVVDEGESNFSVGAESSAEEIDTLILHYYNPIITKKLNMDQVGF